MTFPRLRDLSPVPWTLGLVATVAYAVLSILRFRSVTVTSWDLAIFEQAVAAYSRFEAPIVAVKGPGYHILGDHFSPIYAVLGPIYRVFPSAYTLLVAQAVLVGLSVGIICSLAMRHLGWLGAWLGVLYAVSFGLQNGVISDFHEVAFAVPLLALAGSAFVDGRFNAVVWWSLPLLLVKEEFGMTVAAVGVALWLVGERRKGIGLAIGGVVATIVIVGLIIPAFNAADQYDYADQVSSWHDVVATFFTGLDTKAWTVALTLGVAGFLAAASPWMVVIVPTLLWRFVGNVEFYWGTDWHYSMILMPIVFAALIDTINQREWTRWPATALASGVGIWMFLGSPLTTLAEPATWELDEQARAAHAVVDQIPERAYVEADLGLLKHLVTDRHVYWRGTVGDAIPDWIVFDRAFSDDDIVAYAWDAHSRAYDVVHDDGRYVIARRSR